jgi:hypothetical protein
MTFIDDRGRIFGRVNLVDGAVAAFLLGLIPLAYGSYLLFRPASPRIDSVTPVEITREERRIASGGLLTGKFKVRGTGLNPMLRAFIGDTPAIGFVFETANSADVLVGPVKPGTHDLILRDGVQEVARAPGAITIAPLPRASIRAVGWLTNLDRGTADGLKAGQTWPAPTPVVEILAVGRVQPAHGRVSLGARDSDLPVEGLFEREAALALGCDATTEASSCAIGGRTLVSPGPVVVGLEGGYVFEIAEVLPNVKPQRARAHVRFSDGATTMRAGDRDGLLDERAASITAIERRGSDAVATIELGVDDARDGWRYRGRPVKPGAPFELATSAYIATGSVVDMELVR